MCHYEVNSILSVYFAYFVLLKIFYPIGRRCNCTFCVATSAMVSTYGTAVKMLQNTVHRGLIPFLLMIKTIIKQSQKYTTHMVSSLCNYFPLRIHYNETVSVFMHAIQKLATVLRRVTDQSEHMLLCMM